jgi:hypothetical protein
MFYHNPLAAVVTTLSKLQSDVRTAKHKWLTSFMKTLMREEFHLTM